MRAVPLYFLFAVAACAEPVRSPPDSDGGTPPALEPDECGAATVAAFLGQDVAQFPTQERQGPVRVIRPGQPVTMDYNPMRLNVMLDANDQITGFRCG